MNAARSLVAVATALAVVGGVAERASAQQPRKCIKYSPLGYCLEWEVPTPGTPPRPARTGGDEPTCYWVTIDENLAETDPTVFVDYGLEPPPDGVPIAWQAWTCSDGSFADGFRWYVPADPGTIADSVRGRLAGILAQPAVASSPPIGVAAIVDVPVFVEVTNWTGVVSDGECAGGICVTVTATPTLTFHPGEPSASTIACSGTGTRYDPDGPTPEDQASTAGACAYAYGLRTGAEGRAMAWDGAVSVTWAISWSASTGATGTLPPITRSTAVPRAVEEVQAVVTGGQTP